MYRAHDTRLKRDVAIKVLPEAFAQDPDRLARFQREAAQRWPQILRGGKAVLFNRVRPLKILRGKIEGLIEDS